jgi:DNA polymerase-3 subunit alpha
MDVEYENRKKGASYKVPKLLEKHLKDTYGLLLFQEQIINILADWLDINLGKADIMRKKMEKSTIRDLFNEGNFYQHLFKKYDKQEIEEALNMLQESGGYVFNKSHSAGYSLLGFQMMYLKCYYRKYFNVAILNNEGTDEKGMIKIRKTLQDCYKNNWILPYNLNDINYYFKIDKKGLIIPGVRILKGIGEKKIESVIANKPYKDLADFITRAKCDKTVLEVLNENGFFKNTFGSDIDVNQIREEKNKGKKKNKVVQSEQLF